MRLSPVTEQHRVSGIPSDVATVGRVPEFKRWRCGAEPARRHACESDGFRVHFRSGEVLRDCLVVRFLLTPELVEIVASERWETEPSFPEVPSPLLSSQSWKR